MLAGRCQRSTMICESRSVAPSVVRMLGVVSSRRVSCSGAAKFRDSTFAFAAACMQVPDVAWDLICLCVPYSQLQLLL
jgi:hypothetical protein